jgi:hypothetical protein
MLIDVIVEGQPGQMDDSQLEKRVGIVDDERERTTWTEYWLNGTLVHRSAHVTLKKWPEGLEGIGGLIGK